jgi:hypothetical protein
MSRADPVMHLGCSSRRLKSSVSSPRNHDMKEIPLSKSIEIRAGLSLGVGEIILSSVKKV